MKLNDEKLHTELICKDVNRKILPDKTKVLQRWKGYFSAASNSEVLLECEDQQLDLQEVHTKEDSPISFKISSIINTLRKNKAPGPDKIIAELIKGGGNSWKQESMN
jgi:hypothetical protein